MSVPFQGIWSRSNGVISAVIKQLKMVTFKPVDKITVQFDPFERQVRHARNFLYYVTAPKIQKTNLACLVKTNIVCDRSPPVITCDLASGDKVIFKVENLDIVDILKLYNKHISSLAPIEKPEVTGGRLKKRKKLRIKRKIPRHRQ